MCRRIIGWTMHDSPALQHLGLTLMRISVGAMFLYFGYNKLLSGNANLTEIGSAISLFGFTHAFLLWGYAAALTEFCGGFAYILGFCTRIISLPMIWLLIVALRYHLQKGDPFSVWAFPCICLCIVIGFFITGSGVYSVDYLIHGRTENH